MRLSRRRLLRASGVAGISALGGCTGLFGDDVKDTDGDGMINTEDYAPWDPSVQAKEDVRGADQPPGASTETEEPMETTADPGTEPATTSGAPAGEVLFEEGFEDGAFDDTFEIAKQQSDTDIGVTGDRPNSGSRSLRMRVGQTYSGDIAIARGMPTLSGPRTLSGWVYPNSTNHKIHFGMHGPDGRANLTFSAGQHLVYKTDREPEAENTDGLGNPSLAANPPVDRWYHLLVTGFPSSNEVRFRAADEAGNEWETDRVPATVDFDTVRVFGGDYHGDYHFFVDDVRLANGTVP